MATGQNRIDHHSQVQESPDNRSGGRGRGEGLRVLNLVTTEDEAFFQQQRRTLSETGIAETTLPVSAHPGPDSQRSVFEYLRYVPRTVRRSFDEYDLVHANSGMTAPAALAQPNLPVVVSLWGTDMMGPYGRITRLFARRADEVIVMSDGMAADLDCDSRVLPHGVDTDRFRPLERRRAREAVGWPTDGHQALFPYSEQRAVKDYPRAARVVEAVEERLGEAVSLRTVTDVDHDRMPFYYNAADALVLTSKREGSPNSVKEAMACNVPVVSTDVGDVADRLGPVSNSFVADTDAGLAEALTAVLRRGERSDGRAYADEFSLERMREGILDAYHSVL
ncbi:glycosyltransferase [Haloarchaeobius salinus]|uniref:glycosyltransferase n=1 Tax=Haloarchaeobius salinus TaxID=1198298 RepID=UPI00210D05F4|nr:glycosyltransferase [Haloarchaeobius salinus]